MPDDHHHHDAESVAFGVLTVSSSRDLDADASGDAIVAAVEADGHSVAVRDIVTDEKAAIRGRIEEFAARSDVDAVVTTGGTGVTPDDVTVEAVGELFDRSIPGFGEQFRARSVEEVGPHAMITRATAGVADRTPVFCLPGSEQAAEFGATELVLPVVSHVVGLTSGGGGHDHDGHHDHGNGE